MRYLLALLLALMTGCGSINVPCHESIITLGTESTEEVKMCGPGAKLEKINDQTYKCVCAEPYITVKRGVDW